MDVIRRTAAVLLLLLWLALLLGPARAGASGPVARLVERDGEARLVVRLLRDARAGRVGVLFELAPGWHAYWRSSGDTGLPPELAWQAPGARVGGILWPVPRAFQAGGSDPGAASYGYEGRVLLASPITGAPSPPLEVEGDVLVCEYECVPATFRLTRAPDEAVPGLGADDEAALFADFARRLPEQPSELGLEIAGAWSQSAIRPGDRFEAAIGVRSCTNTEAPGGAHCRPWMPWTGDPLGAFFPDDLETIGLRAGRVLSDASDPNLAWLELTGEADPDDPIEETRLTGVLSLRDPAGRRRFVEVDLPLPGAPAGAEVALLGRPWQPAAAATTAGLGVLQALLLAFLGGLVLNLMPCVLPVLAIKVFSLSQMAEAAHADRREPLRHGLAYTAGILASMGALGCGVLALRAAGRSVGWGFQFQEPLYVAAISAVLVAFALNLFGTFEIRGGAGPLAQLGQEATGARRSFFEGLLAVALATPCTAPFLGTAVGFAFASPPAVILGVFGAIGLGLAAPFLLVAAVPAWARFVPRSGAWMEIVRAGLGFALLATVVWLLFVFGASAGTDGVLSLLAFLLLLSFGLWGFGLLQRSAHPRATVAAGLSVLLLGAFGLNAVSARVPSAGPEEARQPAATPAGEWRPWSPAAVAEALAAGRPVFVRFTADWCITCKVNERVALADDAVARALSEGGFELLVGDWTRRDDAIRSELSRHGRAGVPLYLVYRPERPDEPRMLPELLTPDLVLAALAREGGPRDEGHAAALKSAERTGR